MTSSPLLFRDSAAAPNSIFLFVFHDDFATSDQHSITVSSPLSLLLRTSFRFQTLAYDKRNRNTNRIGEQRPLKMEIEDWIRDEGDDWRISEGWMMVIRIQSLLSELQRGKVVDDDDGAKFCFRGILDESIGEGTHFLIPWVQKPYIFDIKTRPHTFSSISGTKDLQMVNLTLRVLSRPDTAKLPVIVQNLGLEYDERVTLLY
ncbi:unnamed protein product [Vicia faba]|uniref:Prohibitin n=1 Tax=Vicia faba TaxID=3906 RepID=A0AAV0ZEK9_VICFA|nr:unnamed protein product [Vicia faba]